LAVFQQLVGINTTSYCAPTTLTKRRLRQDERDLREPDHRCDQCRDDRDRDQDHRPRRPEADAVRRRRGHSRLGVLGISLSVLSTPHHPGDPAAVITLICVATFIASFAATWGPLVWVVIPEVLPVSVRGTAMGVAVFGNWAANFAVSQTFASLIKALGPGPAFLGYAGLGIVAALFVKAFVTETNGRSLEEIEADLQRAGGVEAASTARHTGPRSPGSPNRKTRTDTRRPPADGRPWQLPPRRFSARYGPGAPVAPGSASVRTIAFALAPVRVALSDWRRSVPRSRA
jgi:MFS family permease